MNSSTIRRSILSIVALAAVCVAPALADPLPGEVLKFEQLPLNDGMGPSVGGAPYFGHDERSIAYLNSAGTGYNGSYVADDFSDKLSTPVVHVQWWGSYFNNVVDNGITQFQISFSSDVPALNGVASHPGPVISSSIVNLGALSPASGTFTEKLINAATPGDHLYQYNGELAVPFKEQANTIYWMSITALTSDQNIGWGWHNRDYGLTNPLFAPVSPGERNIGPAVSPVWHFQDDAIVGGIANGLPVPGFASLFYQDNIDGPQGISSASEDMAFRLYTTSVPEPASLVSLGIGAVGFTFLAYRRRRRTSPAAATHSSIACSPELETSRTTATVAALQPMNMRGTLRCTSNYLGLSKCNHRASALLVAIVIIAATASGALASPIVYQQPPNASTAAFAVNDTVPRILADDFPITQTTQVTDLHVFGAFLSDNLPALGASDVNFSLSLHTDNGLSPSLPVNPPIWQSTTAATSTSLFAVTLGEAFFDPVAGFVGSDTTIYEYNFNIAPQTLSPGVYWLNVEAQPGATVNGVTAIFGWDTTTPASNLGDAAAWGSAALGGYPTPWNSSASNAANPPFNLAFAITGNPVPEPSTICLAGTGLALLIGLAYRRKAQRAAVVLAMMFVLVASPVAMATNLVSNGEFSLFTQGGPNEFLADSNAAPDAKLLDWTNNRPFMAVYGPNASELIGATGPSYSGTEYLWGPLNGSNNGFTDTSPNQATNPSANFLAADGDPGFSGTGISQTISTPLIIGQQYTLSYYWGATQFTDEHGATQSGWTVTLGTQQLVDGTVVNASIPGEGFSGWQYESVNFTYSGGPSDLLSFLVVGAPTGLPPVALLDSVSLTTVPEPTSLALAGLGLLAIVALKLRRHARPALARAGFSL